MAFNPFDHPSKIELGYDEEFGYFLYIENAACNLHLRTGYAVSTALVMQANGITHFDYHSSLLNNSDATETFIREAKAVGFVI